MSVMISLALSMAMVTPRIGVTLQQQVSGVFPQYLDKITPNWEGVNFDFRTTVTELLKQLDVKFWLSPGVDGQITGSFKQAKLSTVLEKFCIQVGGGFQQIGDTVRIYGRGDFDHYDQNHNYYNFAACTPSSQVTITRPELFLSPKQTKGGTFDMLTEAVHLAGYKSLDLMSSGNTGFAIALPFETIDANGAWIETRQRGRPSKMDRFHFKLSYLPRLGTSRLSELFASAIDNEDMDYRMIVLVATTDFEISPPQPLNRVESDMTLSKNFRYQKWAKPPTLTAYVYEFRRPPGQPLGVLVKPGQSKISARQHLILAGLWTEKELQ